MTDWIEHNGGPQPVGDDVWVTLDHGGLTGGCAVAWVPSMVNWKRVTTYRILNQHLIDAKQAEINALRDDLETWQSVFPHVMPDRLKSDQQLADEDVAAKIDAARLEGIRLGLEAAMKIVWKDARWMGSDGPRIGEKLWLTLRDINPETIAREAALDQLTSEAQADNMGYDND